MPPRLVRVSLVACLAAAIAAMAAMLPARAADAPLTIVATTGMIADAAARVGGDRVAVKALMGPGVDPHTYRQTRSDIAAMAGADAVLWHGLYLEAQLEEFFASLGKHKPVIAVAEALPEADLLQHDTYKGRFDPHVWMNPRLWEKVVLATRDALVKLDPDGKATFDANATAYVAEIDALADYADDVLATVPDGARTLVTAHDAFNYFGRAYGYDVMGIQGISTESEAGLKQIEDLVGVLVDKKIGAIFIESSVSDRNVRALIEGAAARGHEVVVGGELYSDAMGAPGTYEGTYLGMIDHNVTIIARALGGEAPAGGSTGRLAAED